jgi:hypothetical protein
MFFLGRKKDMEEKRNTMWAYIITGALILITLIYASVDVYYLPTA